jgi:hypothetical protein
MFGKPICLCYDLMLNSQVTQYIGDADVLAQQKRWGANLCMSLIITIHSPGADLACFQSFALFANIQLKSMGV